MSTQTDLRTNSTTSAIALKRSMIEYSPIEHLPVELILNILKHLTPKDLLNFVNNVDMDFTGMVQYLVDDPTLAAKYPNVPTTLSSELVDDGDRACITILDIFHFDRWDYKVVLKKMACSYNMIMVQGIKEVMTDEIKEYPGSSPMDVFYTNLGAHSTFYISGCEMLEFEGLELPGLHLVVESCGMLCFNNCHSNGSIIIEGCHEGCVERWVEINDCSQQFIDLLDIERLRIETLKIYSHAPFNLLDKYIDAFNVELHGVKSIHGCVFTGIILDTIFNEATPSMKSCSFPHLLRYTMTFTGALFPMTSWLEFGRLEHVTIASWEPDKFLALDQKVDYSFLEPVCSLRLINFIDPLQKASIPGLSKLVLEHDIQFDEVINLDFPHLAMLDLTMEGMTWQIPQFGVNHLETFQVKRRSFLSLDVPSLERAVLSMPKLRNFCFAEHNTELYTNIVNAIRHLAPKIQHLTLHAANLSSMNFGNELLHFPELAVLNISSLGPGSPLLLGIWADRLKLVRLDVPCRAVSYLALFPPSVRVVYISRELGSTRRPAIYDRIWPWKD